MKKIQLDTFEKTIEKNAGKYREISKGKGDLIDSIIDSSRKKSKNVNIRISEFDLEKLNDRSGKEGLPYQTLIASLIHKFVTNQLVDEQDIIKSIRLLKIA